MRSARGPFAIVALAALATLSTALPAPVPTPAGDPEADLEARGKPPTSTSTAIPTPTPPSPPNMFWVQYDFPSVAPPWMTLPYDAAWESSASSWLANDVPSFRSSRLSSMTESYWSSYNHYTSTFYQTTSTARPGNGRRDDTASSTATATSDSASATSTTPSYTASTSAPTSSAPASSATSTTPTDPSATSSTAAASSAVVPTHKKRRIAVVGAGASGSGAAFFLARAARVVEAQLGLPAGSLLEIVMYEKNDYIGGRSTTTIAKGDPSFGIMPLEVGAAIFVQANQNLMKLIRMFGLPAYPTGSNTGVKMNTWDGKNVVYTQIGVPWFDKLTSFFRYGLASPSRQAAAVATFVGRMAKTYAPSLLAQRGVVNSIEAYANSLQLGNEYTSKTGLKWATDTVGVSSLWANEFMDAATRTNYGSDINELHGLATVAGASVSAGGGMFVVGGNWQIFRAMLVDSGADIRLNTQVTNIAPGGTGYTVSSTNSPGNDTYDEVFWANPWHLSPVTKSLQFTTPIPPQEYVKMHVTHLTTTAPRPRSEYFHEPAFANMSNSILTTGEAFRKDGRTRPAFQTILYQFAKDGEFVVLLFSKAELSDAVLADIFGAGTVTWVHRKAWDAYPVLKPTTSYPPVQPRKGFHYLAAMEPWLSTMETQTISAREAVARAVGDWWSLGLGHCVAGSSWDLSCESPFVV